MPRTERRFAGFGDRIATAERRFAGFGDRVAAAER